MNKMNYKKETIKLVELFEKRRFNKIRIKSAKKLKLVFLKCGCIISKTHNYKNKRYIEFTITKKRISLHRKLYEMKYGKIPKDMCVLHNCPSGDNSKCININHLKLGTQQDNIKDRDNKNRQAKGEKQGHHKLTEKQVRQILKLCVLKKKTKYKNQNWKKGYFFKRKYCLKDLAIKFNVEFHTIHKIIRNRSWKYIKRKKIKLSCERTKQ